MGQHTLKLPDSWRKTLIIINPSQLGLHVNCNKHCCDNFRNAIYKSLLITYGYK